MSLRSFTRGAADQPIEPGQRLTLPPDVYMRAKILLRLVEESGDFSLFRTNLLKGVTEAGYTPEELEVLIVGSTSRLRRSSVISRANLAELDDQSSPFTLAMPDPRSDLFRAPFGGCRIDLYVSLERQIKAQPLRAWRTVRG